MGESTVKKVNFFYLAIGVIGSAALILCALLMRSEMINIWVGMALFILGGAFFLSAKLRIFYRTKMFEPQLAEREKAEEKDERNQLITMKIRSRLYDLTLTLEATLFFFFCATKEINSGYCYVMLGLLLLQGLTEVFMRGYYEKNM